VEIERAAMALGPIEPGGSVLTHGGRLAARHVIHAAAMGQDLKTDARLIERATRSAIALAGAHHFHSIALPALGTGVGGFPVAECARLMLRVVREDAAATSVRLVEFVLFSSSSYGEFLAEVEGTLSSGAG
jgi:O-acetyl-ADP-ribose deacetylase (regulator of RNase III)